MLKSDLQIERPASQEVYNAIGVLIAEWAGSDASQQTALLPHLVEEIIRLKSINQSAVAECAAHDRQAA